MEQAGAPNSHILRAPMERNKDWEFWVLAIGDQHFDNPYCNRSLYRKHLEQAKERGAAIVSNGDLFCAMQGKYDPRRSKDNVREEHKRGDYLDALVETGADWHQDYAEWWALQGYGNHETAIRSKLETDILARWTRTMADRYNSPVQLGGYQGWLRFIFEGEGKKVQFSATLNYHHGSGGGGPVTKGTLWPVKRAAVVPDADIVLWSHIHERWVFPVTRERLTNSGRPYTDNQLHVQLSTYKEEYLKGIGYHVERGRPPKPLGGAWIRFYWSRKAERIRWEARFTEDE